MRGAILLVSMGLALLGAPAAAQVKDHAEVCFAGTGKFELDISFCSLAIQSKQHAGPSLATLYAHRGRAKSELGDLEGAVEDFDTALTHNPASALALNERGRARHKAGQNARAIADYDAAIALNPNYGDAYRNRGTARIHLGELAHAIMDFDRAIASVNYDPASRILRGIARYLNGNGNAAVHDLSAALTHAYPYPEAVLWLYLSGERTQARLSANAEAMSGGGWPDALIDMYRGQRSPASALEAAAHPREDIGQRRMTQAHFYLGALAQLQGDETAARKHYEAAIAVGVFDTIEHAAARVHLQKLPQ